MASSSPPSPKRRKLNTDTQTSQETELNTLKNNCNKWKTLSQQQLYSSKLVQALRQRRTNNKAKACEVRAEADRVLARTAKGRTRWSRAILTRVRMTRLKKAKRAKTELKMMKKKKMKMKMVHANSKMDSKVKLLGKLVPGCKGIPVTNLLEEVGDYIAALEMQVRAMTAITDLLNSSTPVSVSIPVSENTS